MLDPLHAAGYTLLAAFALLAVPCVIERMGEVYAGDYEEAAYSGACPDCPEAWEDDSFLSALAAAEPPASYK